LAKLILLSCVLAILAIPLVMSRASSGRHGLRWTIVLIVLFNLVYLFLIRFVYPRLV
jgi:hypothetical protein